MEYVAACSILGSIFLVLLVGFRPTISMKNRAVTGLGFARLIYTDEKGCKLLVSERYNLQGKPDYIFKSFVLGRYIPFEIKSTHLKAEEPHEGDLMQLVAYFLLIEEVYGKKPPYGKLVYANKTFKVRNTLKLRMALKDYLRQMNEMLNRRKEIRCTKSYIKCRNCICNETVCKCKEEK